MKSLLSFGLLLLLIGTINTNIMAQNVQKYSRVKVFLKAGGLNELASLGVAVDNGELKKDKYFITEFSTTEIEIIKNNNFQYEILIDDVSKYYAERNKNNKQDNKKKSLASLGCSADKYITPNNFSLGSFAGFFSYEEIMDELDSMQLRFPNLVSLRQAASTDTTIEGRSIWYVKISDNPNVDETEPEILYSALTHAREPQGMQQLYFFMYYLLENYATNSSVKYMVDNTELFFVPCVNPDGYKYNQDTYPEGGGMHRKNCRQTGAINFGIDLNRNYGYNWAYDDIGSSPSIESNTYRGTSGFSEKETSIMRDFCLSRDFKFVIDYHCYSNVLLYPWGYADLTTPDNPLYQTYSSIMTKENGFIMGTPYQALGYNANGGSMDWYYGEQTIKNKIIVWSPEAGSAEDGFWPQMSRIEPISKSFADMNFQMSLFAGKYANIEDISQNILSSIGYFKFNIHNLGIDTPSTYTISVIPINAAINSIGTQKIFSNMHFCETKTDSISYVLAGNLQDGDEIKFMYKIESEVGIYYSDTITKVFGSPIDVLYDLGNTTTNWTATATWGTTTSSYHSPTKSFTDSPIGNYASNSNTTFTTINYIPIANTAYAELTFWAKWDIEAGYDYVEILASTNGSTWTPLCGKFTKPGNENQNPDSPIYDGLQSTWVKEQIDLTNYLGQSIKLRFQLTSDSYMEGDGFYFDDLKITVLENTTSLKENSLLNNVFSVLPNPFSNKIQVKIPTNNNNKSNYIEIINIYGEKCQTYLTNPLENELIIDTQNLPKGIYIISLNKTERIKIVK